MKFVTVTDAWHPQVNGVVRTIEATNRELVRAGHIAEVIAPSDFRTVPCPGYPEIRLAVLPYRTLSRALRRATPDDLPDVLRDFEATQRPRVETAQENSRQLARWMFHTGTSVAWARDLAMRMVSVDLALRPIQQLLVHRPR